MTLAYFLKKSYKMKNPIILVLIAFLFVSCSKGVNYLYQIDNSDIAMTLDSIEPCQGLYDLISNNVFFDIQDSIFLINDGMWIFLKDYEPCIFKLKDSVLVSLLGIPDTVGKSGIPLYTCYKAKMPVSDKIFYGAGFWDATSYVGKPNRLKGMVERNFRSKKNKQWISNISFSSFRYNRKDKKEAGLSWECRHTRHKANKLSFTKNRNHFINMCELRFSGHLCNDDLAFSKSEMQTLFGKPDLISNDTFFYQTITTPFTNTSGHFPSYKGKVFCSIFVKNDTGGYAYMNGLLVDPKQLK